MENTIAGDIMIPLEKYPHVPHTYTLRETIIRVEKAELEVKGRKSLPRMVLIFDDDYQLMGMARRRDILKGLEPEFLREKPLQYRKKLWEVQVDPALSELSYGHVMEEARIRAENPISDVMIPIRGTVDYNDHIVRVIYEMNKHDLSMLPVLKDDRVVGVVRSVDVFHEVARAIID